MTSCQLLNIVDASVQDRLAHDFRGSLTNTKLAVVVLTPRVHLAELVNSEGVSMATAYFFDQLIL